MSANLLALLLCAAALPHNRATAAAATKPLVGAFYFGDWHVDPQMAALHGPNWTEFEVAVHATPRFPGHLQPNVPQENATCAQRMPLCLKLSACSQFACMLNHSLLKTEENDRAVGMGRNVSEVSPHVMAKKIEAATCVHPWLLSDCIQAPMNMRTCCVLRRHIWHGRLRVGRTVWTSFSLTGTGMRAPPWGGFRTTKGQEVCGSNTHTHAVQYSKHRRPSQSLNGHK
jgi:hypothetical protein